VTFGGGFTSTVFGPVHTVSEKLYRRGINQIDRPFQTTRELKRGICSPKFGIQSGQTLKNTVKNILG
jgi:hypothetical protein